MRFSLLLLLAACAGESALQTLPCEPVSVESEVSFDEGHMLCVQLTMEASDFEELGAQFRFGDSPEDQFPGVIGHILSSCNQPFPDPYTYFRADVVVDGAELADVGVRKKGFIGSVLEGSEERPSLKVKTDQLVPGQLLGQTERITLNNNLTDPTRMRTCLSYSVFRDAGYPAPLCNLANVMVNDRSLGAYTHVESLKKRFLRRAFGNDEGSLYEATIADFTAGHLAGLPDNLGHWEAKTSDTNPTGEPLLGVLEALQATDEDLPAALDDVLDLEMFIQFWALETLVAHVDGLNGNINNTFVYFDPDREGRAVFIPWGTDDAMSQDARVEYITSNLARRLSRHPVLSERYLDELDRLLAEVFDEEVLSGRVESFRVQVQSAETNVDDHNASVEQLLGFIAGRRETLEAFIASGGVEGAEEQPVCGGPEGTEDLVGIGELSTLIAHGCTTAPMGGWPALAPLLLLLLRRRARVQTASRRG